MKILALNPKDFYSGWPVQNDFGREFCRCFALTFPILKRLLPPGHEMRFLDGFFDPIPMNKYLELLRWPELVAMNISGDPQASTRGRTMGMATDKAAAPMIAPMRELMRAAPRARPASPFLVIG